MWQRIKSAFRNFMIGRHGSDMLSMDLVKFGLIIFLLSFVLGLFQNNVTAVISAILSYVSFGMYIYSLVRMFSRNNAKREDQNRRYIAWREQLRTRFRQAMNRLKNRKNYKYFRCPNCKTWIRLPRGSGVVTVTCRKCKTSFTQKS